MRKSAVRVVLFLLGFGLVPGVPAQDSPFVPPEVNRLLTGEISGDISYDHLRHLTLYHSPNGASQGFREKMRWIMARAKEFGLEDVRLIDDLKSDETGWTPRKAELYIVSPEYRRLAGLQDAAVSIADYSRTGTWEGELVDVGEGMRSADYEGKNVKGKIVLASGAPGAVMQQAVWQRGALGIVYYNAARGMVNPDQIAWTRIPSAGRDGKDPTFAFSISYRAGMELKQRLASRTRPSPVPGAFSEETVPGEKIVLKAEVESEFEANFSQWIVEGWIRGTDASLPAVVLTAHGQEEKFSANDDNSGCANLLEIARSLSKLMREGKLQRPRRSIRFWWVDEISAPYLYFAAHPDERAKVLVNINQDMVGAKQSAGSRIQHITRTPWSRPSFLNTVIESVAALVMRGNTAYLSAGQAGSRTPYPKPILSKLGTRERYGAEIVPHFNNTDHMVFNDSIVGIPGVTLTNWPDDFIHSSDDDLWQMDPTQLQRNAFIVAASAWYLATAQPADTAALAGHVHAHALRLAGDSYARALERISLATPAERAATYAEALVMLDYATRTGEATLRSLIALGPPPAAVGMIEGYANGIGSAATFLADAISGHFLALGGAAQSSMGMSEEEKAMQGKVPEVVASVADYLRKRREVRGTGLHGVMSYEVWNFVDGKRSYLEIFRAVRAEAQFAGEWYYGRVTAKQVSDLLDGGVKAGILRLR